jgi:nucleoid DNA-binding protein
MKENILKMISEKAGISEAQAKVAVDTMVSFIHDKMPSGPGHQVELLVQDSIGTLGTVTDTFKDKVSNFFGK